MRSRTLPLLTMAALLATAAAAQRAPRRVTMGIVRPLPKITTPYARTGPLGVQKVSLSAPSVPQYGRLEATVDLSATYGNPFDAQDVRLEGRIVTPSGRQEKVFGFLYQPFTRALQNGSEVLTPAGEPSWRLRYCPSEVGAHTLQIAARDRSGNAGAAPVRFTVTRSANPGFIRVSKADRRYFAFDSGKPYFPVGANVGWGGNRGTFNYDAWFPGYQQAGCNYARLWLSPHWSTFALERPGKASEGHGMGQFDLANAWRLDYVLDQAQARGLYLMLCIDSYNILRDKVSYPEWERTPHNAANGGPLKEPADFWTDSLMDQYYQEKLRYLVARYGASPHVLSWEFWNEVDGTRDYATEPVRAWHERMGRALRELDPYDHMVTTSFGRTEGDLAVDRLPELDYVQTHHYGSPDLARTLAAAQAKKAEYGKPHYVGEIGADAGGARGEDDLEGLQIHNPLWATVASGGSGAAQPWWWDNYIHPKNLYGLFTPVSRFVAGIDWPAEGFKTVTPRVEWRAKPAQLPRGDLVLEGGPVSWSITEYNRPRTVQVTRAGARGELPLAGIQHGLANHRDKHNPVTFQLDLPWPTRFQVEVGDVSGYGGAGLKVSLDGKTALEKQFPDPDEDTKTLTQYRGVYAVEVPAGRHTVVAENTGKDWLMAGFRFQGALERTSPPLDVWALRGKNTALAWARAEGRTWKRVAALKESVPPAPPSVLVFSGMTPGRWKAEVWDTWAGTVTGRQEVTVAKNGEARVMLPAVEKDLAVKLLREGAGPKPQAAIRKQGRR